MKFNIIIEVGEDGFFTAHCPALKSCWSQGKTKEEALNNIKEAIELYLEPEIDGFVEDDKHQLYELSL